MMNGLKHEKLTLMLTLRISRVIMSVISVVFGYSKKRLQWIILSLEAEHRIYDMYGRTWHSAVALATTPKGRKLSMYRMRMIEKIQN